MPYLQTVNKTLDTVNSITNPGYNVGKGLLEQVKSTIQKNN
jgi:hypothetical protein